MRRLGIASVGALILAASFGTAHAAPGYVVGGADLYAGPGPEYPTVASLPPGTPAQIYGCLPGWSWCDVGVDGARGWATGSRLQVIYGDQPEGLPGYGAAIGLPIVGFEFGNYWNRYYQGRPWFSRTDNWGGHGRDGGPGGRPGPGYDGRGQGRGPGPEAGRPGPMPGGGHGQPPGGMEHGPAPRGPESHGPAPRGPEQHGPAPRAPEQHGPAPGGAGPGPRGPEPHGGGGPAQHAPEHGGGGHGSNDGHGPGGGGPH